MNMKGKKSSASKKVKLPTQFGHSRKKSDSTGLRITENAISDISKLNDTDKKSVVEFFKYYDKIDNQRKSLAGQQISANISADVIRVNQNLRAVVTYDKFNKNDVLVLGVAHAGDKKAYNKAYTSFIDKMK